VDSVVLGGVDACLLTAAELFSRPAPGSDAGAWHTSTRHMLV